MSCANLKGRLGPHLLQLPVGPKSNARHRIGWNFFFESAAWIAAKLLGYGKGDSRLMFALSMPQVAATLAVALVAFNSLDANGQRLVDESVLNATIVLVIVTSVLGFIFVDRSVRRLHTDKSVGP